MEDGDVTTIRGGSQSLQGIISGQRSSEDLENDQSRWLVDGWKISKECCRNSRMAKERRKKVGVHRRSLEMVNVRASQALGFHTRGERAEKIVNWEISWVLK